MDPATTALRVVVSLGAVLGLVWVLAKGVRRRGLRSGIDLSRFSVVGRHSLTKSSSVAIVRLGDEALVLGVNDQVVQLLARTPMSAVTGPVGGSAEAAGERVVVREVAAPAAPRTVSLPAPRPAGRAAATAGRTAATAPAGRGGSALAGSALSPATWSSALDTLRERTTRR